MLPGGSGAWNWGHGREEERPGACLAQLGVRFIGEKRWCHRRTLGYPARCRQGPVGSLTRQHLALEPPQT